MYKTVVYLTDIILNEISANIQASDRQLWAQCSRFLQNYSKLSFKKWKNNRILHLRHGMQTSKMFNKPKLSDPFPLQTSIVLWRQIKTMFLGCKSSGPHSAQIKVAEPTGMLTWLCLNQSPGRIKSQNNWNRECTESELTVYWSLKSLCVGQFY